MITEDYVSFETAKLLKKKGFTESEDCLAFYDKKGSIHFCQTFGDISDYEEDTCIDAPTLQMAMKWLREVHGLDIDISIEYIPKKTYYYSILKKTVIRNIDCLHSETNFKSYEEACEAAIRYYLENLI